MMSIDVFFDYTCGFSNRARHWLDAVDSAELVWRPFSLLEQHRGADGPPVFDRPDLADDVSLIALAVHEAVRGEGGDVEGYRRRMFTAWHEEPARLATVDILGFGRDAGLGHFDHDVAFAALGAEHAAGTKLGVFGTPTVVFAPGRVVFVKLDAVPVAGRAQPLWDSVGQLTVGAPELREWQRVTAPEGP